MVLCLGIFNWFKGLIVDHAIGDGLDELAVVLAEVLTSSVSCHGDHQIVFKVNTKGRAGCSTVGVTAVGQTVVVVPCRADAIFLIDVVGGDGVEVNGQLGIACFFAKEIMLSILAAIKKHLADLCHIHRGRLGVP